VEEVEVYETVRPQVDDTLIARVLAAKPDAVCLTSASTAENLRAILGAERLAQLAATTHFVSIGPLTTEAAEKTGIPIAATAPQHDVPGLIDTLLPLLRTP
jgi:uroporphyrinogen-III synthase